MIAEFKGGVDDDDGEKDGDEGERYYDNEDDDEDDDDGDDDGDDDEEDDKAMMMRHFFDLRNSEDQLTRRYLFVSEDFRRCGAISARRKRRGRIFGR